MTTVVLIPFELAHSAEHLISTKGGNIDPGAQARLSNAQSALATIQSKITLLGTMQNSSRAATILQQFRDQETEFTDLRDRAIESVAAAQRPGWNKIVATNIVCTDDPYLNGALNLMQGVDDVLYIRGHCAPGADALQSSDHAADMSIEGLIGIFHGRLSKSFSGKIKVFACESAVANGADASFADRLAKKLFKSGWRSVTVCGYTDKLMTYIVDPAGHKTSQGKNRAMTTRTQALYVPKSRGGCCAIM
ncbi:hypothetical protein F2P44_31380 [Massilia sp. CCM 8695]|uniref:DUF4347 domain-containing protein n=1 Tax=Massilia frigida TaxID=2609281 RepID=A0ABX0NJ55_9BURK|nr:hypothetical protein [Massilia frigida]NHZ83737.1 hypothetical protein [Massilia frigida]